MKLDFNLFIIFLIINALVSLVYLAIGLFLKKTSRRLVIIRCIIMLCAPGVGPLLFYLSWVFYAVFFSREVDLSDVVFSKEKGREVVRSNENMERNFVPIEEAITVTDKTNLRNLVLGVVQGDYRDSLSSIALALGSEDTETAHYAASILQEAINQFRENAEKEYRDIITSDPKEDTEQYIQNIKDLVSYINEFLEQKVLSEVEQTKYTDYMEHIMGLLYEVDDIAITSAMYEQMSLRLLDIKDYDRCESWCKQALGRFPGTLASHTAILKLYFNKGDREQFFMRLNELKSSSIIIDRETLELIRAFQ